MTDKQIIDRVNVKECKYYCNGKCERYEEFVEADYANYSVKCICEKENDLFTYDICDYQQLKRKEQECEELKDLADHNGRVCNVRLDKIDELEHDINELNGQLGQLEAENEELKIKVSGMEINQRNFAMRERLYQSELSTIKHQLEKFVQSIKTTPHSHDAEYNRVVYKGIEDDR